MKKIKIIFLDIDGVLNSNRFYTTIDKNFRISQHDQYGDMFDPISAGLLNKLITATNAKIVVSSTWRLQGFDKMRQMWIDRKMEGEVIGVTPSFHATFKSPNLLTDYKNVSIPRGLEIQWYYETNHNFRHWNWDGDYVQSEKAKCTYCGLPLGDNFSMSYGIPGIPRVYKCKRWWCDLAKHLGYLESKSDINEKK